MAYNFTTASSQYLSTATAPSLTYPVTIAAWCKPSNTGTDSIVCSLNKNSGAFARLVLLRGSDNKFRAQDFGGGNIAAAGATTVSANTLYHAAAVFESFVSRIIYVNGTNDGSNTTNQSPDFSNPDEILVGARRGSGGVGLYFSGDIAEVGIWNVALTADEIASLADGITCDKVRPSALVFYAPLVRNLQDVRGALTITNNNTATVAVHPRVYT
jgi:hypothetical protein